MPTNSLMTAEKYAAQRHELPDGGRWVELVAGETQVLDPPDVAHGNVVLNLSKAFAEHLHRAPKDSGYACFDLGLIVARDPDSIRFPAMSFFAGTRPFEEADHEVTATRPVWVVEIASTAGRRSTMRDRVASYLAWGVETVWVVDPVERELNVLSAGPRREQIRENETAEGPSATQGFRVHVGSLFAEPQWWRGNR